MSSIPDIKDSELWILGTSLKERYGREVEIQLADTDVRLHAGDRELTPCPTFYWEAGDCHFVIFKTGEHLYRCQFYYQAYKQFGTGILEYDDLTECVVSLLQAQADHELKSQGVTPGNNRAS